MHNISTVILKSNSFDIGAFMHGTNKIHGMARKPLSPADLEAAKNLRRIWDEKHKLLGLTQEKAAEIMKFNTQGAVSHYLNGYTPLNTDAVLKFSALLQVSPSAIRQDINDKLNAVLTPKTDISPIASQFISWIAMHSREGHLTDLDLMKLRGRAEQIMDDHEEDGTHDWIVGGSNKRSDRPSAKRKG